MKPLLRGSFASKFAYMLDLVGYLEAVNKAPGGTGSKSIVRQMWVGQRPDNDLEVSDKTNIISEKLGICIPNPNFEYLFGILNGGDV